MTDHIQKTRDMIAVMQAYVDGQKVETCSTFAEHIVWQSIGEPSWSWHTNNYRVATTKDSIDWSHVSPEWNYMARVPSGNTYLFRNKPRQTENDWWLEGYTGLKAFASYRRGNCDWKDSLVRRPE